MGNIFKKRICAFSLIEIMLGLIVVSIMVAAFAPVITKKISNTSVALSQADVVAGKVIKSLVYNYSTALNGVDGCSIVSAGGGSSLQCPFEIPEGVNKINFVLVSGGGGGAGGGANATTTTPVNLTAGQYREININRFMKNVKIPVMASGGGGGGGGYWYYSYTPPSTIRPKSQADCDKIAPNLYYTGSSSCITANNLTHKDLKSTTTIVSLKSQTNNTADKGNKICWDSGNTGYTVYHDGDPNGTATTAHYYHKTGKPFAVCTYPAAQEICANFGYGTTYNGKWRLPYSSEADYLYSNHPLTVYAFTKKTDGNIANKSYYCKANSSVNSVSVYYWTLNGTGCSCANWGWGDTNPKITENYFYNLCLPEYVWLEGGNYKRINSYGNSSSGGSQYSYATYNKCDCDSSGCSYPICNARDFSTNFTSSATSDKGGLIMLNKDYAPFSVRCAIDDIGTRSAVYTYNHSSGGGGASGQYLGNITIPQDKITSAVGGKIIIQAGAGGTGGSASTNGGSATNGGNGGQSYVQVKNAGGSVVWQVILPGGNGGGRGASSSAGTYGSASTTYTITSGSATHTRGNNGTSGINQAFSGSAPGGYGGAAVNGYASGGSGGAAYDTSAGSGGTGGGGYVSLTYDTSYIGAPGGAGAGGKIARFENVSVIEGARYWIKVGGGGAAGNNTNGGNGGQSAFGSYYVNGGGGGYRGINQSATTNPVAGNGGTIIAGATTSGAVFFKDGTNGSAGSINPSTLLGIGGVGGNSGLNTYYLTALSKGYSELSVGCGGYYANATFMCANSSNKNARYSSDEFSNPGKIHRAGSTKYGSAGSGGGGGGIDPNNSTPGTASKGQDGYVYLWWEDYAD